MSVGFQAAKLGLKEMAIEKDKFQPEIENPAESDFEYPYGLCITLNHEVLKNLNIMSSDFKIGDDLNLQCRATVIRLGGKTGRHDSEECMELQITHLGLEEQEKNDGR